MRAPFARTAHLTAAHDDRMPSGAASGRLWRMRSEDGNGGSR
ncbi:MAG: hypothetical protein QM733_23765 [Ilumatobacteraceae bacterium]